MGGDRELVMFFNPAGSGPYLTSQDWIAAGVGIVIWAGTHHVKENG